MPETLYTYVKGVGWIPQAVCSFITKDGFYEVTLEMKIPQAGDFYWEWASGDLERLRKLVSHYHYGPTYSIGGLATGLEDRLVAVYTVRKL